MLLLVLVVVVVLVMYVCDKVYCCCPHAAIAKHKQCIILSWQRARKSLFTFSSHFLHFLSIS